MYVSKNLNAKDLWTKEISLENIFIRDEADLPKDERILVRLRHRAPLLPAIFKNDEIILDEEVKTIAAGQSVVFYHGDICLGGGIVKG